LNLKNIPHGRRFVRSYDPLLDREIPAGRKLDRIRYPNHS